MGTVGLELILLVRPYMATAVKEVGWCHLSIKISLTVWNSQWRNSNGSNHRSLILTNKMFVIIVAIITTLSANGDCSKIIRRRVDYCVKVPCTKLHPTCSIQFRRVNTSSQPSCLSPRQIAPSNVIVKSIFTQNHPVLFHTRFKNFVSTFGSNRKYSQSTCC